MRGQHRFAGVSLLALACIAAASPVTAQTAIEADLETGFETGTDVTQTGSTFTISGGEASGANLFHSFAGFDLAAGDIAQWVRNSADAASIEHVINRVRSGTPSQIDGTIRMADMPNADFWFINPAGVIFGAGAGVDVPNAAHFSSAQDIRFDAGESFSTVTPDGSTFSSAPPQAFGFLGGSADIILEKEFSLEDGARAPDTLTLTAANIALEGNHRFARTGIELIALGVGPVGEINFEALAASDVTASPPGNGAIRFASPDGEGVFVELLSGQDLGAIASDIDFVNTVVGVISEDMGGGLIGLFADSLSLQDSTIVTVTESAAPGADIAIAARTLSLDAATIATDARAEGTGGNIAILARESLSLANSSQISAATFGPGQGGSIALEAQITTLTSDARIETRAGEGASASGGTIAIMGGSLSLDQAMITADAQPTTLGETGTIDIRLAGEFSMRNRAFITASTRTDRPAGDVVVQAQNVLINDAQIFTDTFGAGDAGVVILSAREDFIADGTTLIASSTFGAGRAGGVLIEAPRVAILGSTTVESQSLRPDSGEAGLILIGGTELVRIAQDAAITVSTEGVLNAGTVLIEAGMLEMEGGQITSVTRGAGNAGQVLVNAQNALITGGAEIVSEAAEMSSGLAGGVELMVAGDLVISDRALLSASTLGSGSAGDITITSDTLTIDQGTIRSASDGVFETAAAGSIQINARAFALRGDGRITTSTIAGPGGAVFIDAAEAIEVSNVSSIVASTAGAADAGIVSLRAPSLQVSGGNITSFTVGSGNAGNVLIEAGTLSVSGGRIDSASDLLEGDAGMAGSVSIIADQASLSGGALIDSNGVAGDAGDVSLVIAGALSFADFATVAAQTNGAGEAGMVNVTAASLEMSGGVITSRSTASGNAGAVEVNVGELAMSGGEIGSSAGGSGNAGNVVVNATNAFLAGPSLIESETFEGSSGNAGTVELSASESLTLVDRAEISTTVRGGDLAGDVGIISPNILIDRGSAITSEALGTANAGAIAIIAERLTIANGSAVTTNSENGPAGAIGLLFPEDGVLRLDGREPGVITTSSGANTGGIIAIADPTLILSTGGSILALGEQGGANVQIMSDFFIRSSDRLNQVSVDGSLVLDSQVGEQIAATPPVDLGFLDASGILSGQCAPARAGGGTSQFTSRITGPYGVPERPGAGEPSAEDEPASAPPIAALSSLAACR